MIPRLPKALGSVCLAKLNRLDWQAGLSFAAHGVRVGVRATDPRVMDEVRARLPTGARPRRGPLVDHLVSLVIGDPEPRAGVSRLNLLYAGATRAMRTRYREELLAFLQYHLEEYVAQMSPRGIFVHAGVVGWGRKAIVIPGRSHSGKTTLVKALLDAGATYYSDEYAIFDADGRVHPYPRSLQLRTDGNSLGERVRPEELGVKIGQAPLRVGLLVATEYRQGARFRPRRLSAGSGVLALMANTVPARMRPREVLRTLTRAAAHAQTLNGRRGDARAAAQALLEVAG